MQKTGKLWWFGVAVVCVMSGAPAYGENLLDIIDTALAQDPVFGAAEYTYAAQSESIKQARSQLLPDVSLSYQRRDTHQDIVRSENTVFARGSDRFDSTNYGLRVTQSVFDMERWSRLRQSRATVGRAEAELLEARQSLYLRAAEGYFGVLEQRDQLATVRDEKVALERHLDVARRRHESGLGRQVDVEDADARYLTAVAKEIEVESALADARYGLSVLTGRLPGYLDGMRQDMELKLPEPASAQEWVRQAQQSNPVIIARQHAVEEAHQEVRARRGERYPTLDLVFSGGTQETDGSLFGGGSEVDTEEIALEFKVPLYQGGYRGSRVREAVSEKGLATERLEEAKREINREVRDAFQRVVASTAQVRALTQSVAAQQRTLDTKSRGYESGRYNILEVLDAQQDLSRVQQSATKARYDYALNTLRLKAAAGVLHDTDIEAINGWLKPAGGP